MNNQNLLIYESKILYEIFTELSEFLNFNVKEINQNDLKNLNLYYEDNYLILTDKKDFKFSNQVKIDEFPISYLKLLEKINIKFLKQKFNEQSDVRIYQYTININSREMMLKNLKLKLTEKEVNTIIYLFKKSLPVTIGELQDKVWSYQSELETHTVETHIHRLRKKIKEKFNDNSFIVSTKNGYQISEKK
tara:strand:+ start:966 stop:1538 length:573 start_codon:yes stop_codon:yes gene_type:complete